MYNKVGIVLDQAIEDSRKDRMAYSENDRDFPFCYQVIKLRLFSANHKF